MRILAIFVMALTVFPYYARGEQQFQFKSPSFTGVGYSSHVQTIENTEKTRKDAIESKKFQDAKDAAASVNNTNLQKFLNNFESRVYAQLSSQLVNNLFGENPQNSGMVTISGNAIRYSKNGEEINLTVTGQDGSVTQVIIPVAQFKF